MPTHIIEDKPNNTSSDYDVMLPHWEQAAAVMGGVKTMRMAGVKYLPKFSAEKDEVYRNRLNYARMTNVFADIVFNLATKPFMEQVKLSEKTHDEYVSFSEDVDGCGNSVHVFLTQIFRDSIIDAITWVLIDYSQGIPEGATRAEERQMNARPYWVQYKAIDVLAVYSEFVDSQEQLTQIRLREVHTETVGFSEEKTNKVRIFRHPPGGVVTWELWTEMKINVGNGQVSTTKWVMETQPTELDLDAIPIVPVAFGRRKGKTWVFELPLKDASDLQVELYQQENGLKNIRIQTAFPMLAANNIDPPRDKAGNPAAITVGPQAVLWGGSGGVDGQGGNWAYVEPDGASLTFLREDIKDTIRELRELGRQPLTVHSSNLTVITTAVAAQKGNTAIMFWVSMLKNATENMFRMTGKWLNIADEDVEVIIYDDFDVGFGDDASFKEVLEMSRPGPGGEPPLISREAALEEAKRRGIMRAGYDIPGDLDKITRSDPVVDDGGLQDM